jgi:hypothetical protein
MYANEICNIYFQLLGDHFQKDQRLTNAMRDFTSSINGILNVGNNEILCTFPFLRHVPILKYHRMYRACVDNKQQMLTMVLGKNDVCTWYTHTRDTSCDTSKWARVGGKEMCTVFHRFQHLK